MGPPARTLRPAIIIESLETDLANEERQYRTELRFYPRGGNMPRSGHLTPRRNRERSEYRIYPAT
jgi:hypothetical protein